MVDRRNVAIVMGLLMILGANLAVMGAPGETGEGSTSLAGPSLGFAGGDGSEMNPYQISNVTQLQNMSANVTAHYILNDDIDASSTRGWNSGAGIIPIGDAGSKFNGSLDGNGYAISGITIDRGSSDYVGLFGYIDDARIHNLTISGVSIKGRNRVGGLCGQSEKGMIENCTVLGSIEGIEYIGGIGGVVTGELRDCAVRSQVSGTRYVGGLAGYSNAVITRCSSDLAVSGRSEYIGGLVGRVAGGTLSNSHSNSAVTVTEADSFIGGLAGENSGTISSCYSTGTVICSSTRMMRSIGGLVGENKGPISESYSTGSVVGSCGSMTNAYIGDVGGFVGMNYGTVKYSHASGSVSVSVSAGTSSGRSGFCQRIAGFIGYNTYTGSITYCFSTVSVYVSISAFDSHIQSISGFSSSNSGTISNCYATGSVSCRASGDYTIVEYLGGMVASSYYGRLSNSYSTGHVAGTSAGSQSNTLREIGGLIGNTNRAATACFWDVDTSGTTTGVGGGLSTGVSGKTTSDMMTRGTFEDANWDLNDTWVMIENLTYPCLNGIYHRPIIDIYDYQMIEEDVPVTVSYDVSISDYPSANREKSIGYSTNASSWLTWNETKRTFSGTPTNAEVGSYWLNISAEDLCGGIGWMNVTFEILNVNDPPVITTKDVLVAPEDAQYVVNYEAEDIDPTNDTLTWDMNTTAEWLEMNATTGWLNGTPTNDHVGAYLVNISVTDGHGGVDVTSFMLVVQNTNDDPVITTIDTETVDEDAGYSVHYQATDVDPTGAVFTWDLVTDAPWLTMTENNLHGMPGNEHVGTFQVNVNVSDGNGGTASTNFMVTVTNVNDPPSMITAGVLTATEDVAYSVDYEAMDVDPSDDTLTWGLETEAAWLDIDPATGVLSGTPTNDDVGSAMVTVSVSDGLGGEDATTFLLRVLNVNDPPAMTTEFQGSTMEDETYIVLLSANDEDPTMDDMVWSLETDADWLAILGAQLWGVPANGDVGNYSVTVTVKDGRGGTDSVAYALVVLNVNDPPVIVSSPPNTIVGDSYSFTMEAVDPDAGDTLEWSIEPSGWLSIDSESGEMAGTPGEDDVGDSTVTVTVSDGEVEISGTFTIVVTALPEWLEVPDSMTISVGSPLFLTALCNHGGEYSLSSDPESGIEIDPISGAISWYEPSAGVYQVMVKAKEGNDELTHTFTLTVTDMPPIVSDIEDAKGTVGKLLTVNIDAQDPEGMDLVFKLLQKPSGMVITADGEIAWTPREDQPGSYEVTVTISDGENSELTSFEVKVEAEEENELGNAPLYAIIAVLLILVVFLVLKMRSMAPPEMPPPREDEPVYLEELE